MKVPQTVVLATRNPGKVKELQEMLADFGFDICSLPDNFPEIEETGHTFEENALLKARTVALKLGLPAIADDSGLEVDALGGAPGIYSARYGKDWQLRDGESNDERNNRKLLDSLVHVPMSQRTARFRCCIAFVYPGNKELSDGLLVEGVWEGRIAKNLSGENGFGYDSLFWDEELGCTAAEMSRKEKLSRSHRGKALEKLLVELKRKFREE
jgi:XTP/dITP diphosphohydrolase